MWDSNPHNRLYSNYSEVAVEPAFVKWYRKILANRGFCKKKLDTHSDTLCIKIGVQLWRWMWDSNPHASKRLLQVFKTCPLPLGLIHHGSPYDRGGYMILIQIALQPSNSTFHFMYSPSQRLDSSNNVLLITC